VSGQGLAEDGGSVGASLDRHDAPLVVLDAVSLCEILLQTFTNLAHRARQGEKLGGEAHLGLGLAALESVEAGVGAFTELAEALVRQARLVAKTVHVVAEALHVFTEALENRDGQIVRLHGPLPGDSALRQRKRHATRQSSLFPGDTRRGRVSRGRRPSVRDSRANARCTSTDHCLTFNRAPDSLSSVSASGGGVSQDHGVTRTERPEVSQGLADDGVGLEKIAGVGVSQFASPSVKNVVAASHRKAARCRRFNFDDPCGRLPLASVEMGTRVAGASRMRIPTLLLFAAMVGVSVPSPVQAGAERPVYVRVTGQTAIRFRLALGWTAPCDSTENRMMFDGTLAPGQYTFETGSEVACYQYTFAAFPNSEWSQPRVMPTRIRHGGPLTLTIP
jgi:hypothetical protein